MDDCDNISFLQLVVAAVFGLYNILCILEYR